MDAAETRIPTAQGATIVGFRRDGHPDPRVRSRLRRGLAEQRVAMLWCRPLVSAYGSRYIGRYAATYKEPHSDGVGVVNLRCPSSPRMAPFSRYVRSPCRAERCALRGGANAGRWALARPAEWKLTAWAIDLVREPVVRTHATGDDPRGFPSPIL